MFEKFLNIFLRKKPKVIVLLGPTSTGKTSLAISLAKEFDGEIISADSRQVYKELNLLSGKVTKEEMGGIPHHMLDVISVGEPYSVELYKIESRKIVSEIISRKKVPIICGGTGFYIDSLVYKNNFPEVPPNMNERRELEKMSTESLWQKLNSLDDKRAENIDRNNRVRLIRAIEIANSLGKNPPPPTYKDMKYDTLFIGLDLPDEELKSRIQKRIEGRIKDGMINEAKQIIARGIPVEALLILGLDAKYMAMLANNEITEDQAKSDLFSDTWKYVKRQRVWWKRNKSIKWFNPNNAKEIKGLVKSFLK